MTTLNGRSTKCVVKTVHQSRNQSHRHLGYLYAGYKQLEGDNGKPKGFLFKKDCILPIDEGFEFDENELIEWRENDVVGSTEDGTDRAFPVRMRVVRSVFYSQEPQVSADVAADLEEAGIHTDLDRLQDLHPSAPAQAVAAVGTPVTPRMPVDPALWQVFGTDIASLYLLIRRETNAPPAECQRMATSAFIALREATNKLTPEQVDRLRKASY